ncbi:PREDICTED: uncharacterized protein LOC105448580 [Wasmannia auropunctata]|uniref:uncharacterized protein LOC105448580 n=1 Tax=Wasmannia auropunctata TaxID=64793 RepID=UPI0005F042B9|nr:PREDICTED: uncharacterized protein LOC105448580 [Wasmannia auropunctata]
MAAVLKLKFFIVIIVCFHSRSFYGFKLPDYNGAKIVTYGEPCHSPRYLPVTIEEPAKPVTEFVSPKSCVYQPLKLNYRVISTKPIAYQPQAEYPISVQIPQVPQVPQSEEIITPDPFQGKSYEYNIQALSSPPVPISTKRYNIDFQVPSSPSLISTEPTPQSIKLLTGLTSKIDRILVPACQVSSSNRCNTA